MIHPKYALADSILGRLASEVAAGVPPRRFAATPGLEDFPLRPGELTMLGAPPGAGKTTLAVTLAVDALRAHAGLKCLIANVEMPADRLLARQLARLSGIPLSDIEEHRPGTTDRPGWLDACATLDAVGDRLAFLDGPFSVEHLGGAGLQFEPELVVVDYVQRFGIGDGTSGDRERIDAVMAFLRELCATAGCAVLAVSSLARGKDRKGSTYAGANLASFRGSGELEFAADNAYLLSTNKRGGALLKCAKRRYGKPADVRLHFDFETQSFTPGSETDDVVIEEGLDHFDAAGGDDDGE